MNKITVMKHLPFLLLPLLFLASCEEKQEDHSVLDEMVLLEKEEEDASLISDSGDPQEVPFQETEERQR